MANRRRAGMPSRRRKAMAMVAAEMSLVVGVLAAAAPARAAGAATVVDLGDAFTFESTLDRPIDVNQSDTVLFADPAAVWTTVTKTVTYAAAPASLPAGTFTGAELNSGGLVVGTVSAGNANQAGYWDSAKSSSWSLLNLSTALAALPAGSTVLSTAALGVDDGGEIVGQIDYLDAQQHGENAGFFMSSPTSSAVLVPEPASVGSHGWFLKSITANFELALASENCSNGEAVIINRSTSSTTVVALASSQSDARPLAPDGTLLGSASCGASSDTMRLPDGTQVTLQPASTFSASAASVNASRVAIGNAGEWNSAGTLIPLDSLLPAGSPWTTTGGYGINDGGDVTVQAQQGTGRQDQHYLLLQFTHVVPPPVVNSIGDAGAVQAGANGCDTGSTVNVNGSTQPECTLRAAIQAENAGSVTQTSITFALPANAGPIQPATALPSLTANGVTIDGTTGPGGDVAINGFSLSQSTADLDLAGTTEVVQGFQFENTYIAIRIDSAVGRDTVRANVIGVNSTTTTAVTAGVDIENSPNNLVGGSTTADRNVISGVSAGVIVHGALATANRIVGDWLGVSIDGLSSFGDNAGVIVEDASGTVIGGATGTPGAAPGNVIDGRTSGGSIGAASNELIAIAGASQSAANNVVQGNVLGLLPDGSTQPSGASDGSTAGILVTGRAAGTMIGGSTAGLGNVIDSFTGAGVEVDGTSVSGTTLAGNEIGTDAAGQTVSATAGQPTGVGVLGARQTTIGIPGAGSNLITGQYYGVGTSATPTPSTVPTIFGGGTYPGTSAATAGALGTLISGNIIGPLAGGHAGPTGKVQNTGVTLQGTGETLGPNNQISWNGIGVSISGPAETVVGNQIGVDSTGQAALPNGTGVIWHLSGGSGNASDDLVLGVPGARANTISGNLTGVVLSSVATVQNNLIGTTTLGGAAVAPYVGTLPQTVQDGETYAQPVALATVAAGSLIGGDQPGMGNVISGNPRDGIDIGAATVVRGNYIGVATNGTSIPNGRDGIAVNAPAIIGATLPGPNGLPVSAGGANVIATNQGIAVDVATGGEPTSVLSNSVYGNSGGGIAVQSGGVGAPQTLGMSQDGTGATVASLLTGANPATGSVVQIFTGDSCGGNGAQGKTLLATVPVTPAGTAYAALPLQPVGTDITTTFTSPSTPVPNATTSPFSVCSVVQPQFGSVSPTTVAPGGTAVATGTGFAVGQAVSVVLHSSEIPLGTFNADAQGNVTVSFTVPAVLALGHHDVTFTTTPGGHFAAAGFTVAASTGPSPSPSTTGSTAVPVPSTGAASTLPVGLVLLVFGAAASALGSRRRRTGASRTSLGHW